MKIFRVVLPTDNIERATQFYAELLGFDGIRVSLGRHYFDCEGVILACFDPHADGDNFVPVPNLDHIYVSTSDLENTHERAKKLDYREISEIETQPWGERSFYLKDFFGNQLCFVDSTTLFTGG